MPCHVPATSVSCRRRALYQMRPPAIAAKLDLSKPGEAWAEDYLRRASTGSDAFWRPLGIRRDAAAMFVAVRWLVGFLNRHGLTAFGWYRIFAGAALLALALAGVVSVNK